MTFCLSLEEFSIYFFWVGIPIVYWCPLSTVSCLMFTVYCLPSSVYCFQSSVFYLLSYIYFLPFTGGLLSTFYYLLSTIYYSKNKREIEIEREFVFGDRIVKQTLRLKVTENSILYNQISFLWLNTLYIAKNNEFFHLFVLAFFSLK